MTSTDIKIWESNPISFATLRQRVMAFCYENNCPPDDLLIAPYTEIEHDTVISMGIRISYNKPESD